MPTAITDKYPSLRAADLIAKVARVTLKDTIRVLMSLDLIVDFAGIDVEDILSQTYSADKPTEEESIACNTAYAGLERYLDENEDGGWIDVIRAID